MELFNKRNFTCDCGTTRLPSTSPCTLRLNPETNAKDGVHSETPDSNNKYNHNFKNRFCGCECDYDPEQQKGTMFQCLGLGTAESHGCGEDWWHPGCVVGLGPDWFETTSQKDGHRTVKTAGHLAPITEAKEDATDDSKSATEEARVNGSNQPAETAELNEDVDDEDPPLPPGFPHEDDFEGFICYKCVDANPWIKRYAGSPGFLAPVFRRSLAPSPEASISDDSMVLSSSNGLHTKKRKSEDQEYDASGPTKRVKDEVSADKDASTELSFQANDAISSPG